jgi:hypothetical protein|tara:strand:+ start:247 stop:387 length:141 start_codon:yes stop_codon:yes gene_type:complete
MIEKNPKIEMKIEEGYCHSTALMTITIWVHSRDVMIEKNVKQKEKI